MTEGRSHDSHADLPADAPDGPAHARNRAAFWTGVGSLFDLKGNTSYRRMSKLMPEPTAARAVRTTDPDVMRRLRSDFPELYRAHVAAFERRAETDSRVRLAPVSETRAFVRRGQLGALAVVSGVLALSTYVLSLGVMTTQVVCPVGMAG